MDEHLIMEAKSGDREAMAGLLYDNYEIVFRYLIKFTLQKSLAEDLVQETMVRAIEKINLYDPNRSRFSTWLIAVAQNIYLDSLRKKKSEQKFVEEEGASVEFYEGLPEQDDSLRQVLDSLSRLPDDTRIPLILKHYHGYTYEEIAVFMSIPLGTVKSRIHNGLEKVRKELNSYEGK